MSKRHVIYSHKLRAWKDVGKDSYWRYSRILGWVQMSLDELLYWSRVRGTHVGLMGD